MAQCALLDYKIHFNSHARVGRDPPALPRSFAGGYFNSHARVGRDMENRQGLLSLPYFNSHARVGRDMLHVLRLFPRG